MCSDQKRHVSIINNTNNCFVTKTGSRILFFTFGKRNLYFVLLFIFCWLAFVFYVVYGFLLLVESWEGQIAPHRSSIAHLECRIFHPCLASHTLAPLSAPTPPSHGRNAPLSAPTSPSSSGWWVGGVPWWDQPSGIPSLLLLWLSNTSLTTGQRQWW